MRRELNIISEYMENNMNCNSKKLQDFIDYKEDKNKEKKVFNELFK